ncbi:hypothetical protein DFQ30_009850 [Apophysomyces sp. BC1015]|nr:hypothetical protein DFQ30_009850 [Apophysomyces sp. BC1015]
MPHPTAGQKARAENGQIVMQNSVEVKGSEAEDWEPLGLTDDMMMNASRSYLQWKDGADKTYGFNCNQQQDLPTVDTSKTVVNDKTAECEIDLIKDAHKNLTEMLAPKHGTTSRFNEMKTSEPRWERQRNRTRSIEELDNMQSRQLQENAATKLTDFYMRKSVDTHCEPSGLKKQTAIPTSLPPPIPTRHENVWPMTLETLDGPKLVVGTLSFNALVTSSTRLDQSVKPSIGAVTTNFMLSQLGDSLATVIYVDQESARKAIALAGNTEATCITMTDYSGQLRQLNTKFHHPSTFHLTRASGPITAVHQCQPYSNFTLYDFDRGRNPPAQVLRPNFARKDLRGRTRWQNQNH